MKYSFIIVQHSHSIEHFNAFARRQDTEIIIVRTGSQVNGGIDVKYIESPGAGYGAAVNRGMGVAQGEYLIICNDDVFPESDFLEHIGIDDIQIPVVYNMNNEIESMGAHVNWLGYGTMNRKIEGNALIAGSIFVIRRPILCNEPFDEDYFLYYEDTDLGMRLKGNRSMVINDKLRAYHRHSFSSAGMKRFYLQRNRLLFTTKFRHVMGSMRYIVILMFEPIIMTMQMLFGASLQPMIARIEALKLIRKFNGKAKNIH